MAIDWSDSIVLAQLSDEPSLSEELSALTDRIGDPADRDETAGPVPHVVLDFSEVTYINSSNIAQLLRISKRLEAMNRQMRLCGMGDEVWSVMLVTGLDKVFKVAPDTMTALAGLQIDDATPDHE